MSHVSGSQGSTWETCTELQAPCLGLALPGHCGHLESAPEDINSVSTSLSQINNQKSKLRDWSCGISTGHRHLNWAQVKDPAALLEVQFPANVTGKSAKDGPSAWLLEPNREIHLYCTTWTVLLHSLLSYLSGPGAAPTSPPSLRSSLASPQTAALPAPDFA